MHKILILAPNKKGGAAEPIERALTQAGHHQVCRRALDTARQDALDALCTAFEGRPPDVLIADLTDAPDSLPLRHARRLLQTAWGDDAPLPAILALLAPRHLAQPDWPAYADDFLLAPHAPEEAAARVGLLLFRKRQVQGGDRLACAGVTLDLAQCQALDASGRPLPLTPREYDLLRFLCTHRGKFFGRDRLLDLVWGVDFDGGERTVDIHVRRLRAKLPPEAADRLETRRGIGYGLVA